jgi:hypothetical protein
MRMQDKLAAGTGLMAVCEQQGIAIMMLHQNVGYVQSQRAPHCYLDVASKELTKL